MTSCNFTRRLVSLEFLLQMACYRSVCNDCVLSVIQGWGGVCRYLRSVKPLAWVIVMGDMLHRVADGIALGAAISQSLGGGLSTAIAILFHEVPHVLGE